MLTGFIWSEELAEWMPSIFFPGTEVGHRMAREIEASLAKQGVTIWFQGF